MCYKVKVDFFLKKKICFNKKQKEEDMFIHGLNDNIKKNVDL